MKGNRSNGLDYISRISTDVLIEEKLPKTQKPKILYEIIEKMFPGSRKIEIFARNHNVRKGWISLGNQLGEYFDWARDEICCDDCEKKIDVGKKRFKNKKMANSDLCQECLEKSEVFKKEDFYELENTVDDMVFHEWYKCNSCGIAPLWGIRFSCLDCEDLDLCEE